MRISEWLAKAEAELSSASILTARLDSLIILEDVLKKDRAWLLANPHSSISSTQLQLLKKLLNRRNSHEPLAYIRNKTEFYGREFYINNHVLEPRPESETLIDCLLRLPGRSKDWLLADIGSGSGAIGITAAIELNTNNVDLLEIDPEALKVSKINVDKYTLSLSVIASDLLEASSKKYTVLLCNLPYVPDEFHINLAASHEPAIAIFGGHDGLDIYRKLFQQIRELKYKPLYILTESLPTQHQQLENIAKKNLYQLFFSEDFIQVFTLSNNKI